MTAEISSAILRWLAWNSLYATIAFAAVALLLRFWKRAPASVAHLCWWIVFIRLLLPVDFGLPFSVANLVPSSGDEGEQLVLVSFPFDAVQEASASGAPTSVRPDETWWLTALLALWGVGVVLVFSSLVRRRHRVTALLVDARDVEDPAVLAILADCMGDLGVDRPVRLVQGKGLASPFTVGIVRPVVWIPTKLLEQLDAELLRCLIAHELVHVARRDDLFIRLQLVFQSVFFFHPLVWLAGSGLDRTREQACDYRVVTGVAIAPRDYGRSLVETLRLNLTPANPLASFGGGLKRSLEMRLHALSTVSSRSRLLLAVPFIAAWLLLPMARSAAAGASFPTTPPPATMTSEQPEGAIAERSEQSSDDVMRVGHGITAPRVVRRVEPQYTKEAREKGVVGVVILEAVIDEQGRVERVRPLKDLPFGLTEAATEAVKQWEFEPAKKDGTPVKVFFNLTINFKLGPGVKLTHPLPESRVTSRFGDERGREGETLKIHSGTDLAAPTGTPVLAAANGVVVTATTYDPDRESAGTFVIIDHGSATKTFYSHLDTLAVTAGQRVQAGETIGTVGNTGVSSGPHLHFEVWSGDHPVDPMRLIRQVP